VGGGVTLDIWLRKHMEFEWEPRKRDATLAKWGIDFVRMTVGFLDPNRLDTTDKRRNYGESRINNIAQCAGEVYHITYTMRGTACRIISARMASRKERRLYARN
jgi:uncharacterized DUF497 family protein